MIDDYWKDRLEEAIKNCYSSGHCDNCIPIGKRSPSARISDGRFDTEEKCCYTRSHSTGCPVSVRIKQERDMAEHDAAVREKVLDELRSRIEASTHCQGCIYFNKECTGIELSRVLCVVDAEIEAIQERDKS